LPVNGVAVAVIYFYGVRDNLACFRVQFVFCCVFSQWYEYWRAGLLIDHIVELAYLLLRVTFFACLLVYVDVYFILNFFGLVCTTRNCYDYKNH
jgi:hypothetical protein